MKLKMGPPSGRPILLLSVFIEVILHKTGSSPAYSPRGSVLYADVQLPVQWKVPVHSFPNGFLPDLPGKTA